jgi:membrane protein implicated in regulation of membrane protease activity
MTISPVSLLALIFGLIAVWAALHTTKLWLTTTAGIAAIICGILSFDFAPWPLQVIMVSALLILSRLQLPTDI